MASALTSYGWFAPDDLGLAIEQGHAWIEAPWAPMADAIRSPILSWLFWALMHAAQALSITDRADVLRFAYSALGLFSLLAIPAAYLLTQPRLGDKAAATAAQLVAVYALMPHITTRGLIEVIAIVPLLWGLVACERAADASCGSARLKYGMFAGLGLGAACLIRFQLGLLFVPALWRLGNSATPRSLPRRPAFSWAWAQAWLGLCAGGAIMGAVQLVMDLKMDRGVFGTLRGYLHFNMHYSQGLGTSAWYTYLGEFALLILPPVGLWLVPGVVRAGKAHPLVGTCLVFFVAVHSAIGHKEDRFMFTVLPLLLVLLAHALVVKEAEGPSGRRIATGFWCLNGIVLAFAVTSDAHRNVTDPLLHLGRAPQPQRVYAVGFTVPALPRYYMGAQTQLRHVQDVGQLSDELYADAVWRPDYVLLRHTPDAAAQSQLERLPFVRCTQAQAFAGDWVDRLLVRVNRHNRLRAPTSLWRCTQDGEPLSAAAERRTM